MTKKQPHNEMQIRQRKMIHEFVKRRHKEMHDEEIEDYVEDEKACIWLTPRGTIDYVEIDDMHILIDHIEIMQAQNIPCKIYYDWHHARANLYWYWKINW